MDWKSDKCSVCGEDLQAIQEMLGRTFIRNRNCLCRREEYDRRRSTEENQQKQNRVKQLLSNSMMGGNFRQKTFENWNHAIGNEEMFTMATNYAEQFQEMKKQHIGITIWGDPGNGKTYASMAIANRLLDKGIPVICVSINSILERFRASYNTWGHEGEDTILNGLRNADLLIIDDLGTEQLNEWSKTKIYQIMDSRYNNGEPLPIIITTNFKMQEIMDKYDRRTYERIVEMAPPIKNRMKSVRMNKAKEKTEVINKLFEKKE